MKLAKLAIAFTLGILTCLGLQWWVMAWMEPDKEPWGSGKITFGKAYVFPDANDRAFLMVQSDETQIWSPKHVSIVSKQEPLVIKRGNEYLISFWNPPRDLSGIRWPSWWVLTNTFPIITPLPWFGYTNWITNTPPFFTPVPGAVLTNQTIQMPVPEDSSTFIRYTK